MHCSCSNTYWGVQPHTKLPPHSLPLPPHSLQSQVLFLPLRPLVRLPQGPLHRAFALAAYTHLHERGIIRLLRTSTWSQHCVCLLYEAIS